MRDLGVEIWRYGIDVVEEEVGFLICIWSFWFWEGWNVEMWKKWSRWVRWWVLIGIGWCEMMEMWDWFGVLWECEGVGGGLMFCVVLYCSLKDLRLRIGWILSLDKWWIWMNFEFGWILSLDEFWVLDDVVGYLFECYC